MVGLNGGAEACRPRPLLVYQNDVNQYIPSVLTGAGTSQYCGNRPTRVNT